MFFKKMKVLNITALGKYVVIKYRTKEVIEDLLDKGNLRVEIEEKKNYNSKALKFKKIGKKTFSVVYKIENRNLFINDVMENGLEVKIYFNDGIRKRYIKKVEKKKVYTSVIKRVTNSKKYKVILKGKADPVKVIEKKCKKELNRIIKLIYKLGYKFIKVDEKTIMFLAYHGRGYLCNPKYIHQYMINNPEYKDYKYVWAVKDTNVEIDNCKIVKYNSFKYFFYLAKSKYWIFNCKMPKHILKKEGQVYLQTWHGTPLKKLAHDIKVSENTTFYRTGMSREEMTKTYDDDAKKYDYFISPNNFSSDKFATSFSIEKNKIIETGYPRNDYLTNISNDEINRLRGKYKIPEGKKIVLYAPTWRDNEYGNKGYTFELKADFIKWKENLGEDCIVIFKPHYLIINRYNSKNLEDFLYTVNANADINELYAISDMLITDYSSVFFDYAVLNRPILFYMYDLENYRDNLRGFYLDINEDLPSDVIEDEDALLEEVKKRINEVNNIDEKMYRFNERFNYLQDGNCSRKVLDIVLNKG